jgi:hypothetical protein
VPNQLDCLVRLQLGEVDAVVTDGALAASQAAQDPTVELKGKPFTDEYYGVAMKKDATDLIRRVNQILVDYRKADWQKSYDTWLAGRSARATGRPRSSTSSRNVPVVPHEQFFTRYFTKVLHAVLHAVLHEARGDRWATRDPPGR